MTQAEWQRVRDLFERAIDVPPDDLDAWLDREAASDPEVRAEVASLLNHHSQTGAFLAEPIGDRAAVLIGEEKAFEAGQIIGTYTIVREIGRGGMGRVYLAHDSRLNRTVALKVLPPESTADPAGRERLRREARAAAALTHPGICTVYALEEIDGELLMVAEFIDGHTLRDEMEGGRPSAAEVLDLARQLSAALASAHARGIAHRDLKPENIMRARDGRWKVLDFGLARSNGPGSDPLAARVTQPATIVGTPAYMAPEQLTGGTVDARADVFAFGVVLYEYASGVHPFAAPTPLATIARILEGAPEPLSQQIPGIPAAIASVIDRCLKKLPEHRFNSAADIVRALDESSVATEDRPTSAMAWWRMHQLIIIALYLIAASAAWQIKEWQPGITTALFIAICVAGSVGGVLRGHLVFTARMNSRGLTAERLRAAPITLVSDLAIAICLAGGGLLLGFARPLPASLTMALAIGIALARLILERATTAAAFSELP